MLDSEIVSKVISLIPFNTYNNVKFAASDQQIEYLQYGNVVKFPYRIYYVDIQDSVFNQFSDTEKAILHCIYSRCCDGYVREKHIKALLSTAYPDWTIPYIVKVCDEYVIEILETVYTVLQNQDNERIKHFCMENKKSFCLSYNRMISYWNEFYRKECYHYKNYIGRKLFIECFGYTRSMERKK